MKKQTVFYVAIVLILIAVVIATCNFMDSPPAPLAVSPNTAAIFQSEMKKIEARYQASIRNLQEENTKLIAQVEADKLELKKVRQKASVTSTKVKQLSEKTKAEQDTSAKIIYCDSLREEVAILMDESSHKDELCDQTIKDLTELAETKDSIITAGDTRCEELQNLLDHSLNEQTFLSDQVKDLNKQLKKKSRRQKWLSAGVLILSGITSALLLSK